MSRAAFAKRFPEDRACALPLAAVRWPNGFVCPACGDVKGRELSGKKFTWECAKCGRQTSVTAGTVMHRSKLPLTTWFMAIHLVSSHSNGISALQLQTQLGLGSYKTAWLMLQKLRRAMVDPHHSQLADLVLLPWIHRVFANFKRWAMGTFHGVRKVHLHRYLDEFVYRWNRRRHVLAAFDTLLGLVMELRHASYRDFVAQQV
jgi:predicted RNA-binding Zn-ribbon protein involved in translation (DUF1610 family)